MFLAKIPPPIQRRVSRWFGRRPNWVKPKLPLISFTFDDFPRSALSVGGVILHERGLHGTYYASFGLMGKKAPTGEMFRREDLHEVIQRGHELACHTFDHCDSWETDPDEFEASIVRNQQAVAEQVPGLRLTSFSYPISCPRPESKRRVAAHFECARGGGQTFNVGVVDANYLKSFFIEQSRDKFDAIRQTIDANVRATGWLIFVTHDVCDAPTRFGCTPVLFQRVVEHSIKSGALVLPVHAAFQQVRRPVNDLSL
jgi:peptidoglycan/xylan/chitin deacetylase (PgdA/CDA1 family)